MRPKVVLALAAMMLAAGIGSRLAAQAPAGGGGAAAPAQGRGGGGRATFPAQQRAAADPALSARGRTLYEINCRSCHGQDLRGGDIGGPNLLRSQIVLRDNEGELLEPLIRDGVMTPGAATVMPPLPLSTDDVRAVAAYIHDIVRTARGQGAPPPGPEVELNILVGDAAAGRAYFEARCSGCHSATGDLSDIGARISDPKTLQNVWVGGGRGGGTGVTVTVTPATGGPIQGTLVSVDDFMVVLTTPDGRRRSFARRGDVPAVTIDDPRSTHNDLLEVYNDSDIHDVTAYLVTLK